MALNHNDVSPLSRGERMLIARRRRQFAKFLGVGRFLYQQYELDQSVGPEVAVGRLSDVEVCLILRRRHGLSEFDVGKEMGLSRSYVSMMERGAVGSARLVEYWTERVTRNQRRN
jgi:hypothetical protein